MSTASSKEFRLLVVGPPVVGKSALTIRLTQSEFANEYDPTIEDSYRYYCTIDGTPASLDILDTAGQEEYSSMRDLYMKTGEGFLLVFSLTDRQTFEEITTFYNQIQRVKGESFQFVPMMLVGNKSDLINDRQVSPEEAIQMAKRFDCAYIETSAKTGANVNDAFHGLLKMIMRNGVLGVGLENTIYPSAEEERQAQLQREREARNQQSSQLNSENEHYTSNQNKINAKSINEGSQIDNSNALGNDFNPDSGNKFSTAAAGTTSTIKDNSKSTSSTKVGSQPVNSSAGAKDSSGGGCCVIV
ncbi:hypothetical protein CANINC_000283 [Pichia inconspicua]|uniref:small monomeric GTPase n=1 Tax=Pichia inconspicua TaxID=52247 RepID=A0A4T0X6K0_9ASCO|nr:hypothetical protein CANINC_000283 [[Candida] inconspicua]